MAIVKTMTFLAALRRDRIDAPWVLDGPINGEAFKTYVRNELLKTLKPGDIVVLDNLGSHKGKAVRNMIRDAGAHLMFLPPYSLDLNPIEQAFAKINHLMRRAMERTVEAAQVGSSASSIRSRQANAQTTSAGQDMRQPNCDAL
jgi:putative transposase